jgi:dynein heavy chain
MLEKKQAKLAEVEKQLEELRRKYEESLAEKTKLANEIQVTSVRIKRASLLTTGLSEERGLWSEKLGDLESHFGTLVGDTFLVAAAITYFGPFTLELRRALWERWVQSCKDAGLVTSPDFSIAGRMATPAQVRDWSIMGLPSDQHSVENAVLTLKAPKWPLLVDPQGQANTWIRNLEKSRGLKVVHPTDPTYMRTIENAIRVGAPVLLEDVGEELDPLLEPLLLKQITRTGGRSVVRIGSTDVDYDEQFRLYITTKLANPHHLPSVFISTNVINAAVLPKGLED